MEIGFLDFDLLGLEEEELGVMFVGISLGSLSSTICSISYLIGFFSLFEMKTAQDIPVYSLRALSIMILIKKWCEMSFGVPF